MEEGVMSDPEGRFLFLKGKITDTSYTFANVYAPNQGQYRFLARTLRTLKRFAERVVVLGGDITLIPKEGKEQCGNYRTIYRINTNLKLLDKVLVTQLQLHIPSLVHEDQ
ncbi:Hypothetical predicted protein, partial [Pelobates cultripes]